MGMIPSMGDMASAGGAVPWPDISLIPVISLGDASLNQISRDQIQLTNEKGDFDSDYYFQAMGLGMFLEGTNDIRRKKQMKNEQINEPAE